MSASEEIPSICEICVHKNFAFLHLCVYKINATLMWYS